MAVDGDGNVLMVAADQLYRYAIDDDSLISLGRLDTNGITEGSGMAWNEDTGTLWVLDGPSQQIVELRLD